MEKLHYKFMSFFVLCIHHMQDLYCSILIGIGVPKTRSVYKTVLNELLNYAGFKDIQFIHMSEELVTL